MQPSSQVCLRDFIQRRDYSDEEIRFMLDLEFVQDLANIYYLKCGWVEMPLIDRVGRQQVL